MLREKKGNSLIKLIDDYIVLDIETTGLCPEFDEIIELGAIRVNNGIITDTFESLVKPEDSICGFITELTGITNKMLSGAPPISEILPDFLKFISNNTIVGHNVNFDINFLYDEAVNINTFLSNDFIDTLRLSKRVYKDFPNHKLKTLIKKLNLPKNRYHRALSDCFCTNALYINIKDFVRANNIELSLKRKYTKSLNAKDILPTVEFFDEDHPLFGKICVFTGTLDNLTRKDAMQLVVNVGGLCSNSITRKTNYLILGNNDYCSTIRDGKSSKQKKAEELKLAGYDIEIIPESVFYDMLDIN